MNKTINSLTNDIKTSKTNINKDNKTLKININKDNKKSNIDNDNKTLKININKKSNIDKDIKNNKILKTNINKDNKKSNIDKDNKTLKININKDNKKSNIDNDNKTLKTNINKGAKCSVNGKKYELEVYNIVKKCKLNGKKFNIQSENELGGCSSKNDIQCSMNLEKDISIEIKKLKAPDWMQCSLKYDNINKKWIGSSKNKIPNVSKQIFENLITTITLFNGQIPPFMLKDITHEEWIKIKSKTTDFNDTYINCPNDTIMQLYSQKECKYIQISNKGLYHLGNDICNFNVPIFICDQQLRIRTKVHRRKNNKGFCNLSVTVACQPKNIKHLINSKYSLDNQMNLPINLIYDY